MPKRLQDCGLVTKDIAFIRSEDATQTAKWQAVPTIQTRDETLMKKFHLVTVFVLALSAASHAADLPLPVKAPITRRLHC